MRTADVLESVGSLATQLKVYAARLPSVVHLATVSTGVKPRPEAVENYEEIVTRARTLIAGTRYKSLGDSLIDSLEAFERGNLLEAVQPLLAVLDHLERMQHDKEIEVGRIDEKRIAEYRGALRRILPGNSPELDAAGRGA